MKNNFELPGFYQPGSTVIYYHHNHQTVSTENDSKPCLLRMSCKLWRKPGKQKLQLTLKHLPTAVVTLGLILDWNVVSVFQWRPRGAEWVLSNCSLEVKGQGTWFTCTIKFDTKLNIVAIQWAAVKLCDIVQSHCNVTSWWIFIADHTN